MINFFVRNIDYKKNFIIIVSDKKINFLSKNCLFIYLFIYILVKVIRFFKFESEK